MEFDKLVEQLSDWCTKVSEATEEANTIIKEKGMPENVICVDAVDIPSVRKGDVIEVKAGSLNGDYFVLSVSHDAIGQTMSLTLEKAVAS